MGQTIRLGIDVASRADHRAGCAERYKITPEAAQQLKKRAGRGSKESTKAAPAPDPPSAKAIPVAGAA